VSKANGGVSHDCGNKTKLLELLGDKADVVEMEGAHSKSLLLTYDSDEISATSAATSMRVSLTIQTTRVITRPMASMTS
jgi:hypothetical protein